MLTVVSNHSFFHKKHFYFLILVKQQVWEREDGCVWYIGITWVTSVLGFVAGGLFEVELVDYNEMVSGWVPVS